MSSFRSSSNAVPAGSRLRIALVASMLALAGVATARGGRPPRCPDVPVSVSFVAPDFAPAAISNDLPTTAYRDGVDGVGAVIHFNSSCDGTRDMTLNLQSSSRALSMQFPSAIPGSIITGGPPSFAGGSAFLAKAFFNVHNVLAYPLATTPSVFYTKVTGQIPAAPDGKHYNFVFFPDNGTCPGVCAPVQDGVNAANNQPAEAAWAKVTYMPRDTNQPWSLTNTDTWVVDGEFTSSPDPTIERATLFFVAKNGSTTHYGQYSLPFKLTITALAPLP